MMPLKKRKLSRTIMLAVAIFALILFISVTLFLGMNYYYNEMQELSDEAFAFARSAAKYIDGDKVPGYLENATMNANGEMEYPLDDYYYEVWEYLTLMRDEHKLMQYYYVFIPNGSTITYIWDAGDDANSSQIGDTEEYDITVIERMYNKHPDEVLTTYADEQWGNIACAFYPIYNSQGEPVAAVGVDLSMDGMRSSFAGYLITIIVAITAVVILASVIFYLLVRHRLVKPIDKLNAATQKIVSNLDSNEVFRIDIDTGDELEELALSFSKMDRDLKEYIQRLSTVTAEKEHIGAELNIASQIQADMLPRTFPAFPDHSEFDIYATMTPAKEVGGDFYDFFMVDDDHIALVIADVSGKGVPAALFMVIAKTLIKNHAQLGESPSEILSHVNEQLCEGNEAELFVTVWLAIIEISTGKGIAANAGHEHPALRRADGQYELVVYRHSTAVAVMEGLPFAQHEFELRPGDTLFVYTDGVAEAANSDLQLFTTDRMLSALNSDTSATPQQLLANVRRAIGRFVGDADQFDDITMMAFSYFGSRSAKADDSLTVDATDENLDSVMSFIRERMEGMGCGPKTVRLAETAAEEIYLNIAHYAYSPGVGQVTVSIEHAAAPDRAVVTFTDSGREFDPLAKNDPDLTLSADDRPIGGLGIFMAKNFADAISYERKDGRNVLRFEKAVQGA